MRGSEKWQVVSDAMKAGAVSAGAAVALGHASVETTILFGLITTGSVVSLPLVAAWALGGAVVGGGMSLLAIRMRHRLIAAR